VTLLDPTNITIEILKGIRGEVKSTNVRIDSLHGEVKQTNARIDSLHGEVKQTNARIDSLREELSHRIVASEVRTATAIADLAFATREMTDVLRAQHDLRPRVDRCEQEISALKLRVGMG
jgi:peptidoglycan hydrolase CwlO-like protein